MGVAFSPSGEFFSSVGADEQVQVTGGVTGGGRAYHTTYSSQFSLLKIFVILEVYAKNVIHTLIFFKTTKVWSYLYAGHIVLYMLSICNYGAICMCT